MENSSEVVKIVDLDGTLRYASPSLGSVLGYVPEEMIGRNVLDYVHPEDLALVASETARALAEPGVARNTAHYRFRHADGSWRHVESTGAYLLEDPAVGGVVVITRDVTERVRAREAEQRLRETEELYRVIVEQTPAITYVFSQRPGSRSVPTYVSPQIERILGYTPGEYVSDPELWRRIIHPEDRERVLSEDIRTGGTGDDFCQEFRMVARDGRAVWFREDGRLLRTEENGFQLWHGIMYDITELKLTEERLKRAERRYRTLVEQVPPVVYVQEPRGERPGSYDVTYMSPRAEPVLGYPAQAFIEDQGLWDRLIHPDDLGKVAAEDERTDLTGEPFSMEYRMTHSDGHIVWVRDEATLFHDETGHPLYWQGVMTDVTQRKRYEEQLEMSEARYRALVEQVPAVNYTLELAPHDGDTMLEGAITYIGPQVERVLGYHPESFTNDRGFWMSLVHPEDRELVLAEDRRTDDTGEPFSMEYRMTHSDGRVVWIRDEAALTLEGQARGKQWQGVLLDVTERKMLEQELERRATHDSLTGLPNRALLAESLHQSLSRTKRTGSELAILFIDLDDFKEVNDALGHDSGDRVLVETAGRLQTAVRIEDTVARLGGDEFVVLLEDTGREAARLTADRIAAALDPPFDTGAGRVSVTASVGVVSGSHHTTGPDELLRNADRAMYLAKEGGKNRFVML